MPPTRRAFVKAAALAPFAVPALTWPAGADGASHAEPVFTGPPPVRISLSSFDARALGSLLLSSDGSVWLREFDDEGRQRGLCPLFAADELMTPGAALRALLAATTVS